jgi:hypothetical protein
MTETKEYQDAVAQLFYWQHKGSTSFSADLYHLIAKADPINLAKIKMGFPHYVHAWASWQADESGGKEFFAKYGFNKE